MTKRMLIDATHPEETRVAVVSGNRLEEYDFESIARKQLKGNIYLVKVTRVEPSLQAAFVDFGGNRHGFLPFPEIHPDYYRIPIADREALLAEEREMAEEEYERTEDGETTAEEDESQDETAPVEATDETTTDEMPSDEITGDEATENTEEETAGEETDAAETEEETAPENEAENTSAENDETTVPPEGNGETEREARPPAGRKTNVETVGGGDFGDRPYRSNLKRRYKIQEVIKRGQIMLVQISKEERGTKGAAVTTYISLPGRYCVLMPNSPRGGGVSRKVSSMQDRQRMKQLMNELEIPDGMSVILRTAGVERNKVEVKRDFDYLTKLWDGIRELTMSSTAPALINEEGNLVKRSIRDLYRKDLDEVLVAGEQGYRTAREFMKILMPSHARRVKFYQEEHIPLFYRYQVETQIDEIHSPTVRLKSGGYIVIGTTEALVAIDVNSGRATKGRHIEETALKTNIEAAEEVARQLRLRDLGGLVVIDFIDMEDMRNNRIVERKLKEAMQHDRARIQLGRISAFGLLELSRQRLHPSLVETNFETCPHCQGAGLVRTVETTAVNVLRAIEEEGIRARADEIRVCVPSKVALYIINQKRAMLSDIEARHFMRVQIEADDSLTRPSYRIDILKAASPDRPKPVIEKKPILIEEDDDLPPEEPEELEEETTAEASEEGFSSEGDDLPPEETSGEGHDGGQRHRRGRRHRGRHRFRGNNNNGNGNSNDGENAEGNVENAEFPGRRRGRRGGRRRRGGRNRHRHGNDQNGQEQGNAAVDIADQPQPSVEMSDFPTHKGGSNRSNDNGGHYERPQQRTATPERPAPASAPAAAPEPESSGPPRKGWWKRLTE